MASWVARYGSVVSHWKAQDTDALYAGLEAWRAFKPDSDLPAVLDLVSALFELDLSALQRAVAEAIDGVDVAALTGRGFQGAELGAAIASARKEILHRARG